MPIKNPYIFLFLIISLLASCTPPEIIGGGTSMPAVQAIGTPAPLDGTPDVPPDQSIDYLYKITWSDENLTGSSNSIYYSLEDDFSNARLLVKDIPGEEPGNVYYWNTAGVQEGDYYIFIRQTIGGKSSQLEKIGPVRIRHKLVCIDVSSRVNLLPNSSLEDGRRSVAGNGPIAGWKVNQPGSEAEFNWVDDPSQTYSGGHAILFENSFNGVNTRSARPDLVTLESEMIELPTPGGKYLFTAWVKTEDIESGHIQIQFRYFDHNGQELKLEGHNQDTFHDWANGTTNWTQIIHLLNVPHWDSPPYSKNARAEKITISIALDHSPGKLWADDLALFEISEEEYERYFSGNRYPAPEIMVTETPVNLPKKEGWATSIQQDPKTGIWWIVDSEQKAFWGVGINIGPNEKIGAFTGLEYADYRNQAQYKAHTDLNFNVGWRIVDDQGSESGTQNFIYWMNFSSAPSIDAEPETWVLKDRGGNLIGDFGHYFPDVFSPVWQNHALREAQTLTKNGGWILKSDRVLGYWTDNEFSYGELYDYIWGDTAKLAFVDWLQGKNELPSVDEVFAREGLSIDIDVPGGFEIKNPYVTIDQLNETWSSEFHSYKYTSFDDVYGFDVPYIRSHYDPVKEDLYAFERVIYKIYVDTIIDNIRKVETDYMAMEGNSFHRPIFSNRFHLRSPAAMLSLKRNMDLFSRFDAIAVNLYPTVNQNGTYLPYDLMNIVKSTFHDTTGLPIYIGEFGVASEDGDNYDLQPYLTMERWRVKSVPFQYQRGWMYRNLVSTWANLPWVIGANWFSWFNGYGIPHGSDVRNSGLVDDNNNYYPHLANEVRSVNDSINQILRSPNFTLESINWENIDVHICQ
jgi:hypothetical protein